MKTLRIALLAAAVAVGLPGGAYAQDRDRGDGGDRGGECSGRPDGDRQGRRDGGDRQQQAAPQQAAPQVQQAQGDRRDARGGDRGPQDRAAQYRGAQYEGRDGRQDGNRFDGNRSNDRRFDDRGPGRPDDRRFDDRRADNRGPGYGRDNRPGPDRAWRPGYNWRSDRSYDWRGYRASNRSIFSVGRYYAPRNWGYGYRRFSVGYRLPSYFYAQNYWLDDPYAYHLPPAYGPYRWIRYYGDVLMVDLRTGQIVDSIPDFFL